MAREARDLRIALFIDFENLVTRTGITPEDFDLEPALDKLLARGKIVFRRAYADWIRFSGARAHLHDKGVELVDVPPSTRAGKNAADIRLVIDALELAYQREHVDAFAVASGDSDFCPLAYKLREIGRSVIGLAVKEATSPLFVKACDEFIYFRPPARPEKKGAAEKKPKAAAKPPASPEVPPIARETVSEMLADATEPVGQSSVMNAIVRREPDFDVKEHGFSTFSRLLEALEKEGLLKRQQNEKGQWYLVPA